CYFFTFGWLLARLAPIMARHASRLEWAGVHLLAGMMLGLYPDFARSLLRHPLPEPAELPPPELAAAAESANTTVAVDPVSETGPLETHPPSANTGPAT